jgi:hypothetical protein
MRLKFDPRLLTTALNYAMLTVALVVHALEGNARVIRLAVQPGLSHKIVPPIGMHGITLMKRTDSYETSPSGDLEADDLVKNWFRISKIALTGSVSENGGASYYTRIPLCRNDMWMGA